MTKILFVIDWKKLNKNRGVLACQWKIWGKFNDLGVNHGWKQNVEIGKVNNQNFVGIPYASLQFMLKYLGEKCGIRVVEQEESYTSKASFPDRDYIPVYNPDKPVKHQFFGHREKRGLYKLKSRDIRINADLNGADNILRKAFPKAFNNGFEHRFLDKILTCTLGQTKSGKDRGCVNKPSGSIG